MAAVLAIALGLACLYLWLSGHWFGRVVGFLVFTPIGVAIVANIPAFAGYQIWGYLAVAVAAWFVAGVPALWRRLGAPAAPDAPFNLTIERPR